MVADRCVILPGTRLGKGAVLGSGSLAPEDFYVPPGAGGQELSNQRHAEPLRRRLLHEQGHLHSSAALGHRTLQHCLASVLHMFAQLRYALGSDHLQGRHAV